MTRRRTPLLRALSLGVALAAWAGCAPARSTREAPAPVGAAPHGTLRADSLWSPALGAWKRLVVYLPPSYGRDARRRYASAYYLHGMWGDETNWADRARLGAVMDSLVARGGREMLVVMPDGDDGYYTTWATLGDYAGCLRRPPVDQPPEHYCVPWPRYDEYLARDVVGHVDSSYRTIADAAHRGVAGLSMGGYGAVTLALRYPGVWSAAASHSGVLSPLYLGPHPYAAGAARFATSGAELEARWGKSFWPLLEPVFGSDTASWWTRDPARLAERALAAGRPLPALSLDVGTDDPFVDQNRAFHAALTALGIAHRYHEWPGTHNWDYWRAHEPESLSWLMETLAR